MNDTSSLKPKVRPDSNEHYVGRSGKKYRNGNGLSKDTWVRIALWFIPLIFTAGMFFYFVQDLSANDAKHDKVIDKIEEKQQGNVVEQELIKFKIDAMSKKQTEVVNDVKKIDEKLDDQKDDLTAIKVKLGVRSRRSSARSDDD